MAEDREDKLQRGLTASNADYLRYDRVEKSQRYLLAEQEGAEEFDTETEIQTCDLGRVLAGGAAEREAFARELGTALETTGFAILVGHGIVPEVHADAAALVPEVFARPLEEKLSFRARRFGSVSQGYFPKAETSDIHPDLVEGWVLCRRAFDLPGAEHLGPRRPLEEFWPDPAHEPVFRRLVEANERLILPVMQSLLYHLGLDPSLYDGKLTRPNIGLRLNYYPPLTEVEEQTGAGRLLGHEDVGMFVFLPAPEVEGLQVLNRRNMKWIRLDAPPGSIILNTGDYVQRITNDRYSSTTHRVSRPRDAAQRTLARVSLPMNVYVWEDEILEALPGLGPAKYPPIRAVEFHTQSTAKFYGDDYAVSS